MIKMCMIRDKETNIDKPILLETTRELKKGEQYRIIVSVDKKIISITNNNIDNIIFESEISYIDDTNCNEMVTIMIMVKTQYNEWVDKISNGDMLGINCTLVEITEKDNIHMLTFENL